MVDSGDSRPVVGSPSGGDGDERVVVDLPPSDLVDPTLVVTGEGREEEEMARTAPAEMEEATGVVGGGKGEVMEVDLALGGGERCGSVTGEGQGETVVARTVVVTAWEAPSMADSGSGVVEAVGPMMGSDSDVVETPERAEEVVRRAEGVPGVWDGDRVVEIYGLEVAVSPRVASQVGMSTVQKGKGVAGGEPSGSSTFTAGPVGITPQDFAESASQEDVLTVERETPGVLDAVREAVLESREAELAWVRALVQEEEARVQ